MNGSKNKQVMFSAALLSATLLLSGCDDVYYREPDRRPFLTTDVVTETFTIQIPPGGLKFGYSVDASWELPDPNPPQNVPDDFPITANSIEAYRISAHVSEGLTEYGGSATCEIDIFDWQGTDTISTVQIESDLFYGLLYPELDTDFGTISKWSVVIDNEDEFPEVVGIN